MPAPVGSPLHYQPRTVLICCMRLIGDVILTTPLIGILKEAYPDISIDFLVNRKTGEFLEKDSRVRKVIYSETFDIDQNKHIGGRSYFKQIFRKYDLAINTNYADRGNISAVLAGRHSRVGFWVESGFLKDFWKKFSLSHPVKYTPDEHIAYRCKVIAENLGLSVQNLVCKVFWNAEDEKKVSQTLAEQMEKEKYFVVHPFARGKYKMWPMERFVEVSDTIASRYGLQPVWTSSPAQDEADLLNEVTSKCLHKPIVVPGSFTLNQMTYLLAEASLYVGLDTAISHLAATTGTHMVVLFGPTPAICWAPWDNNIAADDQRAVAKGARLYRNIVMIQKEWDCVPCKKKGCPDLEDVRLCLEDIQVQEVVAAVKQLIDK